MGWFGMSDGEVSKEKWGSGAASVVTREPMLYPLASSSAGNCTAIVAGGLVIVVDAGISRRETIGRLADLGVLHDKKTAPDVLLLTHDHADHARYVSTWIEHTQPVFATCGTANRLGIERETHWRRVRPFEPRNLAPGVVATAIMVPHDAAEPVAWRVAAGGRAAIVATDLGSFPAGWDLFCTGCTEMLLEASYHPDLLNSGSYPDKTKLRVKCAHLSVLQCAEWVRDNLPDTVERLFIGHISHRNCDVNIVRHLVGQACKRKNVRLEVLEK